MIDDQSDIGVHVYRVSTVNKAAAVVAGVAGLGLGGYLFGLIVPHIRSGLAHQDLNTIGSLVLIVALFALALFSAIAPSRMHVTITNSHVEVVGAFSHDVVSFADISGRRCAAGKNVSGMYLYRRDKSRVFVRESMLQLDDFYERWKASIYDLDMADRLKRKAAGKEQWADSFFCDDHEQHPAIGGPDGIA